MRSMYRFIVIATLIGVLPACQDGVPGNVTQGDSGSDSGAADAAEESSSDAASGCYLGTDCDPASQVCDPATRECVPYQCNALLPCPSPMVCANQNATAGGGACYPPCEPFAPEGGGCPTGQECKAGRIDGTIGLCADPGSNALGQPCVDSAVSTDCMSGLWCFKTFATSFVCAEPCDYWNDQKLCTGNLRCHPDLACAPLSSALSVGFGEPCAGAPNELWGCAPDATHIRGLCVQEATGLVCRAMCRTALGASDCNAGETCNPTDYNPILGFCQPS